MPNIRPILCLVNDAVQVGAFSKAPFSSGKWNTIAYDLKTIDKDIEIIQPAVITAQDDNKPLSFDDTYPLQVYHKIDSGSYSINEKYDFGQSGTFMTETFNMRMVLMGDRAKLKKEQEDIMAMAIYYFPKQFTDAQIRPLGLTNVEITVDGFELNPYAVFDREYRNVPFSLSPNNILLSVSYKLETIFSGKCFDLCSAEVINS